MFDALGGIPQAPDHDKNPTSPAPPAGGPVPDTLVTFGSGVNQLASLQVSVQRGRPRKRLRKSPLRARCGAILSDHYFARLSVCQDPIRKHDSLACGRSRGGLVRRHAGQRSPDMERRPIDRYADSSGLAAGPREGCGQETQGMGHIPSDNSALGFFFFYFLFLRPHLPAFPVIILYIALILLAASLVMILLSSTEDMVANSVEKPRA